MLVIIPLVLAISVLAVYLVLRRRFQYWNKKNVPYQQPAPVLGNFSKFILMRKDVGSLTRELCERFPNAPYFGAYYGTEPTLIVKDPDLIKQVMTKDFYFFSGREVSKYNHRELLVQNLFFSYGDKWKVLRQNLTPLFSSAKMKNMFHLIEKCSRVFETVLDQETKAGEDIEMRSLIGRFTMDCVGSCAFGVDTNTQEQKEGNSFSDIGNIIFDNRTSRGLKLVTRAIWPAVFYGLGFRVFPKKIETFFYTLLTEIFKGRQYKPSSRNDFVDLVLNLWDNRVLTGDSLANMKLKGKESKALKVNIEISEDMLVSQCFVIFAAGYETSATTLGFTLYELAKNPKAQDKAFEEVKAYLRRHNKVLRYECVAETPYLEACVDEALRLYPVLVVLTREVVEDYVLEDGLKLEKGIRIHIPVYHLHHNPDFFPEPEKYIPERFFGEEKRNIKPYTYLPFGEGPRICIGMRFARMQMIAGLITLLKKYRVELAPDMKSSVSLEPRSIIIKPIGGINLKLIEREGWQQRLLQSPS